MCRNIKLYKNKIIVLIIAFFSVQCSGDYYPIAEIFAPINDIPMVKYQSIADGETGVELLPEIVITFSEPMHFRSIKKNLFFKEENITDVTCDVTIDSDLKKITIKPYNFLKNNSVYNILIKKDARTAKLYPLPNDIEINFITTDDDTIKPEILGTNIDDRLDDVAGNENIIVYFSKPMDLDSFQNNILLKDNADATIDFALSASGVSAFIKPIEPLAPYGEYTLIIKNYAYDTSLFKNKLKDGKTINFKVKGEYKLRSVIGASKYLYTPSFVAVSDINGERYLYTTSTDNKIRMYKKNKDVLLSDNNPYTDPSSNSYILIKEWNVLGKNEGEYSYASGLDIDAAGNAYIADTDLNRVVKYDYQGNFITSFGRSGDGYGEFNAPYDVAYGKGGFIYVVDKRNYRVQKFDLKGNFITGWGTKGTGDGEFSDLRGISTDIQGNVYVVNIGVKDGVIYIPTTAVYKYDPDGVYIGKIGGDGKLINPTDVAIDANQTAYVSDRFTQEICIYDKFGAYLDKITTDKRPNGLYYMDYKIYIAEDTDNSVLLYDIADKKYNPILSSLFYLTEFQNNLSNLNNPLDFAIDNSGDLIIVNSGGYNVKKYDSDCKYLEPNENYGTFSGAFFFYPVGIDVDKRGRIFLADPGNTSIETFDSDFNFIKSFGQFGNGVGNFYYPYHIDISESEEIFISDSELGKILKFDYDGNFINEWLVANTTGDDTTTITSVKVYNGFTFVLSNNTSTIYVYDVFGNYLTKYDGSDVETGNFDNPMELTIDKDGLIYVADTYNHRVVIYGYENNNFIYKDHFSTGEYTPTSIEVNDSKTVYILDSTKNGILIYDLLSY